jgi:hypothetical protein
MAKAVFFLFCYFHLLERTESLQNYVNVDYKTRSEPEEIIEALKKTFSKNEYNLSSYL